MICRMDQDATRKSAKKSEAIVECKMFDVVDLNIDIPWTITKMDDEEELKDVEQGTEPMAELTKVLSFSRKDEKIALILIATKGTDEGSNN